MEIAVTEMEIIMAVRLVYIEYARHFSVYRVRSGVAGFPVPLVIVVCIHCAQQGGELPFSFVFLVRKLRHVFAFPGTNSALNLPFDSPFMFILNAIFTLGK